MSEPTKRLDRLKDEAKQASKKFRRCSILIKKGGSRKWYLSLEATLPPKPTPNGMVNCRRIALGLQATLPNLAVAIKKARRLNAQLEAGCFSWDEWLLKRPSTRLAKPAGAPKPSKLTVKDLEAAINERYRHKHPNCLMRWDSAYGKRQQPAIRYLRKALGNRRLTTDELALAIQSIESPSTRLTTKSIVVGAIKWRRWGKTLDCDALHEVGAGYRAEEINPRDVPSDETILRKWIALEDELKGDVKREHWLWAYGMCAAFGLRPHELAKVDFVAGTGGQRVRVSGRTKTGRRQVFACMAEWVERFELEDIKRPPQRPTCIANAGAAFLGGRIDSNLYNLRHAYAIRLMRQGVTCSQAALLMGHSEKVHLQTYRRWISDKAMDELFEKIGGKLRDKPG